MWTRTELKDRAKIALKANYWNVVLAALILSVVTGGISGGTGSFVNNSSGSGNSSSGQYSSGSDFSRGLGNMDTGTIAIFAGVVGIVVLLSLVIGLALKIFLCNPFEIGAKRFFSHSFVERATISEVTYAIHHNYMNAVKTMFLRDLYVSLWSLLFVIPGIVKSYEYYMVPYLLAEDPDMDSKTAFEESRRMMDGQKWKAFELDVSFLGWYILGGCTCGILCLFYVNPYVYLTKAALFRKLSGIDRATGYSGTGYGNPYGNPTGGNPYQPGDGSGDSVQNPSNNSDFQGYGSGYFHDDTIDRQ